MVRRHHTGRNGRWVRPSADGVELFNLAKVPITRHRYRGAQIPDPRTLANPARRQTQWRARCVETRMAGAASGLGKRTDGTLGTAPKADSTIAIGMPSDQRLDGFVPVLA